MLKINSTRAHRKYSSGIFRLRVEQNSFLSFLSSIKNASKEESVVKTDFKLASKTCTRTVTGRARSREAQNAFSVIKSIVF